MDLYPSVDVTIEKKTKAVLAVCRHFGYGFDENGEEIPGAWDDQPAMLAFYRDKLNAMLLRWHQIESHKADVASRPKPEDYSLDN